METSYQNFSEGQKNCRMRKEPPVHKTQQTSTKIKELIRLVFFEATNANKRNR